VQTAATVIKPADVKDATPVQKEANKQARLLDPEKLNSDEFKQQQYQLQVTNRHEDLEHTADELWQQLKDAVLNYAYTC